MSENRVQFQSPQEDKDSHKLEEVMNTSKILVLIEVIMISVSCSKTSPVLPTDIDSNSGSRPIETVINDNTHMWGLWEVHISPETGEAEIIPLRGAAFTANVNEFVDAGKPSNLIFNNLVIEYEGDNTEVSLDVGLRHPFPGLDMYTGFDVIGVFMGDAGTVFPSSGLGIQDESEPRLNNPDGFTRWFNCPEFKSAGESMPLLGYNPGKLGTPGYEPDSELNAYRYFCDGLDKDESAFDYLVLNPEDRGNFLPGSTNYRHYELTFPGINEIVFQYAVIANWEEPSGNGSDLNEFPSGANADEARVIAVEDHSTAWFNEDEVTCGGNFILDITPYDWSASYSGVMEEYEVKCYSDGWAGNGAVDMTPVDSGTNTYTFRMDVPAEGLTSSDPVKVWIEITYPDLDYSNDYEVFNNADGPLSGYFITFAGVDPFQPPGWVELAPMNHPRHHITEQVVDSKIYVIGGFDGDGITTGIVECFDPQTNTWVDKMSMPTPRGDCSSAVVNGLIYVFGGSENYGSNFPIYDVVEVYDPSTDSWQELDPMPGIRAWPMAESIGSDIFITGGFNGSMLTDCWKFSPLDPDPQWTDIAPMPIIRSGHDTASHNGYVYTLGGYDGAPLLRYDPILDSWTGTSDLEPLPASRVHLRLAVLGDLLYSTGGRTVSDDGCFPELKIYSVADDTWTAGPDMPKPLAVHGAVALDDSIYVFGGVTSGNVVNGQLFMYHP